MLKHLFISINLVIFSFFISLSPANAKQQPLSDEFNVQLLEPLKIRDKITGQEEFLTYTGDVAVYDLEQEPTPNHAFVLAVIKISLKQGLDKALTPFNPDEIVLKQQNNVYNRLLDDEFLEKFNFKALPHLKIKKGSFDGIAVFEIPADQKDIPIQLFYQDKEIR